MGDYQKCPDCGGAMTYGLGACPHNCGATGERYPEMLEANGNMTKKELLGIIQKMREALIKLREQNISLTSSISESSVTFCDGKEPDNLLK